MSWTPDFAAIGRDASVRVRYVIAHQLSDKSETCLSSFGTQAMGIGGRGGKRCLQSGRRRMNASAKAVLVYVMNSPTQCRIHSNHHSANSNRPKANAEPRKGISMPAPCSRPTSNTLRGVVPHAHRSVAAFACSFTHVGRGEEKGEGDARSDRDNCLKVKPIHQRPQIPQEKCHQVNALAQRKHETLRCI